MFSAAARLQRLPPAEQDAALGAHGDCKGSLQFEPVLPFGAVPPRPERKLPHRRLRLLKVCALPLPCVPQVAL